MARTRTIRNVKSALAVILVVALTVGVAAGLTTLLGKETTELGWSDFETGALDANGAYVESKTSIVSDYFEYQGLTIDPGTNASGTYQIYYYADDKTFQACSDVMTPQDGIYEYAGESTIARYARVVITPAPPVNEDGNKTTFSVRFWEVAQYAGMYSISVKKEQAYKYASENDLLKDAERQKGKNYWDATGQTRCNNIFEPYSSDKFTVTSPFEIPEEVDVLDLHYKLKRANSECWVVLADANGDIVYTYEFSNAVTGKWFHRVVEVGEQYHYISFVLSDTTDIRLFGFESEVNE